MCLTCKDKIQLIIRSATLHFIKLALCIFLRLLSSFCFFADFFSGKGIISKVPKGCLK